MIRGSGRDELALGGWARKLGCDILISGSTHKADLFERDGRLFLNPGSVTGASQHYGGDCTTPVTERDAEGNDVVRPAIVPSFMLMVFQESTVLVYTYKEIDGQAIVEQHHHQKLEF